MSSFDEAIPVILSHEGTDTNFWVNDPDDPGGETVWGWSMKGIKALGLTPKDLGLPHVNFFPGCLKAVTKDTCKSLYKKYYWNNHYYYSIDNQTVATKVFDAAVNMGPTRAAKLAQQACNALGGDIKVDGNLGPKSFAAINSYDHKTFVNAMAIEMQNFYLKIIERNPSLAKFKKNWFRRAQWGVET